MNKDSFISHLSDLGFPTETSYLSEAFSRNIGLLSASEQLELKNSTVAIPGLGGVGGAHLITLVRSGIGGFHIADFDFFGAENVNRQYGAKVPNFGKPKLDCMLEEALSINPYLKISTFPAGISEESIDSFLDGASIVVDSLDFFAFDARRMLFNKAREKGLYVVTAGPIGFSSAMLIFSPESGMSFDEYFAITESLSAEDKTLLFQLGLTPKTKYLSYIDSSKISHEAKAGPSLALACNLCAGMAATEVIRILLKRSSAKSVPHYYQFDPYLRRFFKGYLPGGNNNPLQRLKVALVKKLLNKNSKRKPLVEVPRPKSTSTGGPAEETLNYILKAGIQAPSGDNVQPWRFRTEGSRIDLFINRKADASLFNVHQLASVISCGAALENIRVCARALGFDPEVRLTPSAEDVDWMASVELHLGEPQDSSLLPAIWKRHTNRRMYKKRPPLPSTLSALENAIGDYPGAKLHVLTDSESLDELAKIVAKIDRIRIENRELHEYLHQMIRYSYKESAEKLDGFPLRNLEAGMAGDMMLRLSRPWPVMQSLNTIGVGRVMAGIIARGLKFSSGAALITVPKTDEHSFLLGGQAFERIWLELTALDLVAQPMAAPTMFLTRAKLDGYEAFKAPHADILRESKPTLEKLFPDVNFDTDGLLMLLRFGTAGPLMEYTRRKPLDSFLF